MNNNSWKQATLPLRFGGLGLRSCQDLAPCFLSSMHASAPLSQQILESSTTYSRELDEAESAWSRRHQSMPTAPTQQREWDNIICKESLQELMTSADQYSKARLLAAQEKHSGAWVEAIPSGNLGTLLSPDELRIAVSLRIGCNICQSTLCRCGQRMDRQGIHGLSCRLNAGRFPRHTELNHIMKRTLSKLNIPTILEPSGLARDDGKRPDGLTLCPWSHGRCLIWDVTVTDTLCPSKVMQSSSACGAAAAAAETAKVNKYKQLSTSYIFQPLAFETTGVWGPSTSTFLNKIQRKLREVSDC